MTLDAEKAGVPVVKVVGWMHPQAHWVHQTHGYVMAHCQRGGPKPIPLVPASELDTARAEIDEARLQQKAWADKWDHTQSALTAAQERIAELEGFVASVRKLAVTLKGAHKLAGPHDPTRRGADRLNKAWADGQYHTGKELLALVRTLSPQGPRSQR